MAAPRDPQREQLELFHAMPGEMPARDVQDLMAYPFFSLAKSRRTVPIDFRTGPVTVRVAGTAEHGIATIWDADILIWAASQIVEARDAGLRSSRLMALLVPAQPAARRVDVRAGCAAVHGNLVTLYLIASRA